MPSWREELVALDARGTLSDHELERLVKDNLNTFLAMEALQHLSDAEKIEHLKRNMRGLSLARRATCRPVEDRAEVLTREVLTLKARANEHYEANELQQAIKCYENATTMFRWAFPEGLLFRKRGSKDWHPQLVSLLVHLHTDHAQAIPKQNDEGVEAARSVLQLCSDALLLEPDCGEAFYRRGQQLLRMNQARPAVADLERAMRLLVHDDQVASTLGQAQEKVSISDEKECCDRSLATTAMKMIDSLGVHLQNTTSDAFRLMRLYVLLDAGLFDRDSYAIKAMLDDPTMPLTEAAHLFLGKLYLYSWCGVEQDVSKALQHLGAAVHGGHPKYITLGCRHWQPGINASGTICKCTSSGKMFSKNSVRMSPVRSGLEACFLLTVLHSAKGKSSAIVIDRSASRAWMTVGWTRFKSTACACNIGLSYSEDIGGSHQKARKWFEKAALSHFSREQAMSAEPHSAPDPNAQSHLAEFHYFGLGGLPRDEARALEFAEAALANSASETFFLQEQRDKCKKLISLIKYGTDDSKTQFLKAGCTTVNFGAPARLETCAFCGKKSDRDHEFNFCSQCKRVTYCSKEHQKAHWKEHKQVCKLSKDDVGGLCRHAEEMKSVDSSTLVGQASLDFAMHIPWIRDNAGRRKFAERCSDFLASDVCQKLKRCTRNGYADRFWSIGDNEAEVARKASIGQRQVWIEVNFDQGDHAGDGTLMADYLDRSVFEAFLERCQDMTQFRVDVSRKLRKMDEHFQSHSPKDFFILFLLEACNAGNCHDCLTVCPFKGDEAAADRVMKRVLFKGWS